MTLQSTVRLCQDQISCDLNGEAAIFNVRTGAYYGLDAVGATIWKLMEQPRTVQSIHEAILCQFDVEDERCQADVLELLEKLSREGLIELVQPEMRDLGDT